MDSKLLLSFSIKSGRFVVDKQTKKVKPQKAKGRIIVEFNQDYETHFRWIDDESKIQELDLIVFAQDAVFEAVPNKSNTYVLKFQTDTDKYFFWLQEKMSEQEVIKKINEVINYVPSDMEAEEPQKIQQQKPIMADKPSNQSQKPIFTQDFISKLTKNIASKNQNEASSITHLERIFNYETMSEIVNSFSQKDIKGMLEHLPEQQRQTKYFSDNARSPQFLQALDVLSDALNSENAVSLFMEMGLNQKHLHKHYGVHAFLVALVEWGKAQKKQEK